MKNKITFFGTLVVTLFSLTSFAQAKLTINMLNKPSDTIYVRGKGFNQMIVADKKGTFSASFAVTDGFYKLDTGEQYADLYLTNKSNLKATLDYSKFDETLKFDGTDAAENNFLAQQTLTQEADMEVLFTATDEADLTKKIENFRSNVMNRLASNLNADFVTKVKESTEKNIKGITEYLKSSLEVKKLNGSVSPTFAYENVEGKIIKLEDFKGKYVYVDVWATWCGPCRAEIPHLKKVEEAFHGKNIEFVSISVDVLKDKEKWKKFVAEKQLGGVQVFADKDWRSDFVTGYKIQGIPRFILIGPDGKIVNADAPRPSSPELTNLLNTIVK